MWSFGPLDPAVIMGLDVPTLQILRAQVIKYLGPQVAIVSSGSYPGDGWQTHWHHIKQRSKTNGKSFARSLWQKLAQKSTVRALRCCWHVRRVTGR